MGDGYQEVQEVISIHAPTRGATSLKATEYKLSIDFNPRSHERSDNYIPDEFKSYIISIHAPTGGATKVACYLATLIKFQSTLPREERQYPKSNICSYQKISIHAPTRGATTALSDFQTLCKDFNPRSHERSDHSSHFVVPC